MLKIAIVHDYLKEYGGAERVVETLLEKTLSRPMDIHLPLAQMTKIDVLQYLNDHGVIDLTVSCWNAALRDNKIQTCHTCANCVEREESLKGILYEYGKPNGQLNS